MKRMNGIEYKVEKSNYDAPDVNIVVKVHPLTQEDFSKCRNKSEILSKIREMLERAQSLRREGFHVEFRIFRNFCDCDWYRCTDFFHFIVRTVDEDGLEFEHIIFTDYLYDDEIQEAMLEAKALMDVDVVTIRCYDTSYTYTIILFASEKPVEAEYIFRYETDPWWEECGKWTFFVHFPVKYVIDTGNIYEIKEKN